MLMTTITGRKNNYCLLLFLALLSASCGLFEGQSGDPVSDRSRGPITIDQQGSFFIGGKIIQTETGNDATVKSVQNPGRANIEQMYVEYQIPAQPRYRLPIVMLPGGGHHGHVYDTTPDGREGWRTYFLRKGFTVYIVDGVNRGRSGYDITDLNLAKQGTKTVSEIPAINRYSHERAWVQFRIGPSFGKPYPGSQFPVEAFAQYAAQLVPAWRDDMDTERNVTALVALLDHIGPAILLTWSQSGLFGWQATLKRPEYVKGIVAIEPSTISPDGVSPGLTPQNLKTLAGVPILIACGDYDPTLAASLRKFASSIGNRASVMVLPEEGQSGNGHVMMVEKNNREIADLIIQRLEKTVPGIVR